MQACLVTRSAPNVKLRRPPKTNLTVNGYLEQLLNIFRKDVYYKANLYNNRISEKDNKGKALGYTGYF